MKEIILDKNYFRILVDSVNKIWTRFSFWTKASDVQFEDGSYLQDKVFGHCILQRNTYYEVGDIAYCTSAPSWVRLSCVVAGTTDNNEPKDYEVIQLPGVKVTDGSAEFRVVDIRPSDEISNSMTQAPSVFLTNELNNRLGEIDNSEQPTKIKPANIRIYVGDDEKLHFKNGVGQDKTLDYRTHDASYTYALNSVGSTVNLGKLHKTRYVNAANVYQKGVQDGINQDTSNVEQITNLYHHHTINATNADNTNQAECPYADTYLSATAVGCFTKPHYTYKQTGSHEERCGHWECTSRSGGTSYFKCTGCGARDSHYDGGASSGWGMGDHYKTVADYGNVFDGYCPACGKTNGQLVQTTIQYK